VEVGRSKMTTIGREGCGSSGRENWNSSWKRRRRRRRRSSSRRRRSRSG
jgi:hypothetical protein